MVKTILLVTMVILVVLCAACGPEESRSYDNGWGMKVIPPIPTQESASATETAIANIVVNLLQGTSIAGATATQYSVLNPSTPSPQPTFDPLSDPAAVVPIWIIAVMEGDSATAARITCQQDRDSVGMSAGVLGLASNLGVDLGSGFSFSELSLQVDLSNVTFTTVSQNEDSAIVAGYGEAGVIFAGFYRTMQISYTEVNLVRENGRWTICAI